MRKTMSQYDEFIERIRTGEANRTVLNDDIAKTEALVRELKARVDAAGVDWTPTATPTSNDREGEKQLAAARFELQRLQGRRNEVDTDLRRLQRLAGAGKRRASAENRRGEIHAELRQAEALRKSAHEKLAELQMQHADARAAADRAADDGAAALLRGDTVVMAPGSELAYRTEVLGRAVSQARSAISEQDAQIAVVRERLRAVQGELDVADLDARTVDLEHAKAQFLPVLHAWAEAAKRAYGWGAADLPDLHQMLREWRNEQAKKDNN